MAGAWLNGGNDCGRSSTLPWRRGQREPQSASSIAGSTPGWRPRPAAGAEALWGRRILVRMEALVVEVPVVVETDVRGAPMVDEVNGRRYCRVTWVRGAGPPYDRGVYLWLDGNYGVLYIGRASSDKTSHLYRRITGYKRATAKKTQRTSLDINAKILELVDRGGQIRLVCLVTPHATADEVARAELALISAARPPWNRQGNPTPRRVDDALPLPDLLGFGSALPQRARFPL